MIHVKKLTELDLVEFNHVKNGDLDSIIELYSKNDLDINRWFKYVKNIGFKLSYVYDMGFIAYKYRSRTKRSEEILNFYLTKMGIEPGSETYENQNQNFTMIMNNPTISIDEMFMNSEQY